MLAVCNQPYFVLLEAGNPGLSMGYKAIQHGVACSGSILCDRSCIGIYGSMRHVLRRKHDPDCQIVNEMGHLVESEGTKTVACGWTM
jgi:hypothetical protein